jgi:hypothetical protein
MKKIEDLKSKTAEKLIKDFINKYAVLQYPSDQVHLDVLRLIG